MIAEDRWASSLAMHVEGGAVAAFLHQEVQKQVPKSGPAQAQRPGGKTESKEGRPGPQGQSQ